MADGTIKRWVTAIFDRVAAKKVETEFEKSLAAAGKAGAKGFLKELRAAFDKRMADLKEQLAKGLIDTKEFRKQADAAGKAFNAAMVKNIEAARKAGELTEKEYIKLSRQFKRAGDEGASAWSRIKGGIVAAGGALAAFFGLRQIARFTVDVIKLGVAGAETASKYTTTFGSATKQMDEFLDTFGKLSGLSRVESQEFSSTIGAMARGMGFTVDAAAKLSQSVLTIAADLTSFNNVPITDTIRAIRSAIVGERESLKTLGVVILETDVQQRALVMSGKEHVKTLTQQEKAAATLALIQERMGPAMGDLVRTQNSLSNQARTVAAAWKDVKDEFGRLLTSSEQGVPVLQRVRGALVGIRDNAEEILSLIGSLTKALVVGGLIFGFTRLAIAIRTATAAATGFVAVWRAGLVMMGPKGWLILGVTALTAAFENASRRARAAAADSKLALDSFREALGTANEVELKAREAEVAAKRARLEQQLASLKAVPVFSGQASERLGGESVVQQANRLKLITKLEGELNQVRAQGLAIDKERTERAKAANTENDAEAKRLAAEAEAERLKRLKESAKARGAELEKTETDLAVIRIQIEKGITEQQAREQVTREKLLSGHVARETATIAQLKKAWEDLARAQTDLRLKGVLDVMPRTAQTGSLGRPFGGTETQAPGALPFVDRGLPLPDQQPQVDTFFDPWFEAMHLLREEVEGAGTLFAELGQAWAEGGLAGFAKMAMHKVKENVARAIEEAAKAFGSFALGNPASAAAHAKAAAGHTAAAAAWRVVGGAAGGGGGGGGSASGGANENRAPNLRGGNVQPVGTEVHLYLSDRIGALVDDVEFQRASLAAMEKARERWGDQARIYVHRGSK